MVEEGSGVRGCQGEMLAHEGWTGGESLVERESPEIKVLSGNVVLLSELCRDLLKHVRETYCENRL